MDGLRRSRLRQLDVDDLIVLNLLYEGKSAKDVSVFLGLTPPAVSHRFSKYVSLFDDKPFFKKVKSKRVPSEYGMEICKRASDTLKILAGK